MEMHRKSAWRFFTKPLILLAWFLPAATQAHDLWLQADGGLGDARPLRLYVGHHLAIENELSFETDRLASLQLVMDESAADLAALGVDGRRPFLTLPPASASRLVALEREWVPRHTLATSKFDSYLSDEGLEDMRKLLANSPDRVNQEERYVRYLKLLLAHDDRAADSLAKRVLGQRLEIVLPLGLGSAGEPARACARFDAAPLQGRRLSIVSMKRGRDPGEVQAAELTTAEDGCVSFTVPDADIVLLRTVHMRRCSDCAAADWESYWTAFTLQR
jgi:uncharacterized GH25 family protein